MIRFLWRWSRWIRPRYWFRCGSCGRPSHVDSAGVSYTTEFGRLHGSCGRCA